MPTTSDWTTNLRTLGAVGVAAAALAVCAGSPAPASTARLRLVKAPVVTLQSGRNPVAYVRFNRTLPLKREGGRTLLRVLVASSGAPDINSEAIGDNALRSGRPGRGCYTSDQLPVPTRPHVGDVIKLRIAAGPRTHPLATFTRAVRIRRAPTGFDHQADDPTLQRLGCVNTRR